MLSVDGQKTPRDRLWDAAYVARLNVEYYQRSLRRLEGWDIALRLGSALLSSAGIVVAVKFIDNQGVTIVVGIVAAVIVTATQVFGLQERIKVAASLLPQYVAHKQRLELLWDKSADNVDEGQLDEAIEAMHETERVEAEKLRSPNEKTRSAAREATNRAIGAATGH